MIRDKIHVNDRQLACARISSKEGQNYLKAMAAAANYAWVNRSSMTFLTRQVNNHGLHQSSFGYLNQIGNYLAFLFIYLFETLGMNSINVQLVFPKCRQFVHLCTCMHDYDLPLDDVLPLSGHPQTFAKAFSTTPDDLDMHVIYDVSHNIAKVEEHISYSMCACAVQCTQKYICYMYLCLHLCACVCGFEDASTVLVPYFSVQAACYCICCVHVHVLCTDTWVGVCSYMYSVTQHCTWFICTPEISYMQLYTGALMADCWGEMLLIHTLGHRCR